MSALDLIRIGLTVAKQATELSPGAVESLTADVPEIFAGGTKLDKELFRRALELAADDLARAQLIGMRQSATSLSVARLGKLRPQHEIITGSAQADLLYTNGEKGRGYLRIEQLSSLSKFFQDRVPTEFISANLFNTVPASAVRKSSFSPDMFADPTIFSRTANHLMERLRNHPIGSMARIYPEVNDILEGSPLRVTVSKDAGQTVEKAFEHRDHLIARAASSSKLRTALQKAIIDREVIGDPDSGLTNVTISETVGKPVIAKAASQPLIGNIDLEMSFGSSTQPALNFAFRDPSLVGQKLKPSIASRAGRFVDAYGTVHGQQLLADLRMEPADISGVLSRAQWFADHKTLPTILGSTE